MNKKVVFLFSGQGSQYRGMGHNLFKNNPVFRRSLEQSDAVVRNLLGRSLINELYFNNDPLFDDLLITHPAIVAVEIAMWHVVDDIGIQPAYVTGNSLGEFAAAVVGGVWSAEHAIEASVEQAKSVLRSGVEGGMLAVISVRSSEMENLYSSHNLFLAADNFNGHFTLSGLAKDLDAFQKELEARDTAFLRLPVNHPFHSPLIESCGSGFKLFMAHSGPLLLPKPGFVSGATCTEPDQLNASYFWDLVSSYTNFPKMVQYLESGGPCMYVDLGPSGTIATFLKYNLTPASLSKTFQLMNLYRREEEQLRTLQRHLQTSAAISQM